MLPFGPDVTLGLCRTFWRWAEILQLGCQRERWWEEGEDEWKDRRDAYLDVIIAHDQCSSHGDLLSQRMCPSICEHQPGLWRTHRVRRSYWRSRDPADVKMPGGDLQLMISERHLGGKCSITGNHKEKWQRLIECLGWLLFLLFFPDHPKEKRQLTLPAAELEA